MPKQNGRSWYHFWYHFSTFLGVLRFRSIWREPAEASKNDVLADYFGIARNPSDFSTNQKVACSSHAGRTIEINKLQTGHISTIRLV